MKGIKMNDVKKRVFKSNNIIFFIAAIVFIVTAYNSHGYYHADEHYQIIEFAGVKSGTNHINDVAWEYKAQIRPTLQPLICMGVFSVLNAIHITDPYLQAFSLRLLTALLALFIIRYFILNTEKFIKQRKHQIVYSVLSYLLWFIPIISVHFSSETGSGLLFLLALAVFFSKKGENSKSIIIGVLLGFSFLFRFQIMLAVLGFVLWFLIIHKTDFIYLIKSLFVLLCVIMVGFLLDSWFYEEWVFTPWNYFYSSIIDDKAPLFGTSSWYYYVKVLLAYPSYFIGVPLILSFLVLIFFMPKNIFLWVIIPFVLFHSMIPHKEERFLFPIIYLFPIILMMAYEQVIEIIRSSKVKKVLNYVLIVMFVFVNSIGLLVMSQKSAGLGRMEITQYIRDQYGNNPIHLIYMDWANPYNPWHGHIHVQFYREDHITDYRIHSLCELKDSIIVPDAVNLLVAWKSQIENTECSEVIELNHFEFEKQSIPQWIIQLTEPYKSYHRLSVLMLYKYEDKNEHNSFEI